MKVMRIGYFHFLILHYPIVLATALVAFDGITLVFKKNFERLAFWTLFFTVFTTIPTVITGSYAADFYASKSNILLCHEILAYITTGFIAFYFLLRIYMEKKKNPNRSKWFFFLSLITFGLIALTAHFGGLLAFGKMP